jgi:hypothetical protein
MTYVDKLNLIMPRLNYVRLPARSREIVFLHPPPGKPGIDLLKRLPPWKGLPRTWNMNLKVQVLITLYEGERSS